MDPSAAITAIRNHPMISISTGHLMDSLWEPLEYVGETLVFLGVMGEVLADGKLILKNDESRRGAVEGLSSWILIAGLAISLGALIGTNEHFNSTIADLNNQAATSNEHAAEASRDAAQLQVKADELEEQILEQGPRNLLLYGKREQQFVKSIRQFKGQKVQVRKCLFNNNEVRDTAERLTDLFKSAGWDVSAHSPDWGESNCMMLGPNERIPTGIWVGTPNSHPTSETQERAGNLVKVLGQVPSASSLHRVGVETARANESRTNIQEQYGAPNSIVVTVLGHEEVATSAGRANTEADAVARKADDLLAELGTAEGKLRQLQVFALARHISDEGALVNALKPFSGEKVMLRSYVGDAEGWTLCVSLLDAVRKAHMDSTDQCGQWPFDVGHPVTGLQIRGPSSGVIAEAIVAKGRTTGGAVATGGPAPLLIFSGIKNPFWFSEKDLVVPPQQESSKSNTKGNKR